MVKQFRLGRYYQHSGGGPTMLIVAIGITQTYGVCYIAEELDGSLHPVSTDDSGTATQGWHEITEDQFLNPPIQAEAPPNSSFMRTEEYRTEMSKFLRSQRPDFRNPRQG